MIVRRVLIGAVASFVFLFGCASGALPPERPGESVAVTPATEPAAPAAEPAAPVPAQLGGAGQDEYLSLRATAHLQPNGTYDVTVSVTNLSTRSVDLLFNCGSLIWWQGLAPDPEDEGRTCPAVHSQLLPGGESERLAASLDPAKVADWSRLAVILRYEPSGGGRAEISAVLRPL